MKILTRYILKEMVPPTLLGLLFYTSIILMQKLFDMAGMIIRRSLSPGEVGQLLALSLPHIVVLTLPMSLLFGILIAIGRLSADSEIIAMRALGSSMRTIYRPVFFFSFVLFLLNLYLMNYVLPRGNTKLAALTTEILTSSIEKELKPRIFYDDYENLMIYVNDVDRQTGAWKGVFIADSRAEDPAGGTTPQDAVNSSSNSGAEGAAAFGQSKSGQRIIVAGGGNLSVVPQTKQLWMNLQNASTHLWDPRRPDRYDLNSNASQRLLLPDKFTGDAVNNKYARSLRQMNLRELLDQERQMKHGDRENYNLARVEIQKKFAIPFACLAFGILGLPLGITNRRGGKSSGFSLSIAIILFYYVMINNGEHMAASGKVSPFVGMWSANLILLGLGIWLLSRANRDAGARQEAGFFSRLFGAIARLFSRKTRDRESVGGHADEQSILSRLDITFPNILDRYVLREFLKILALVLISVVALFVIIDYTDIAGDIRDNHIAFHTVFAYYRFMIFQVLNWALPISVLVATLVTFGMLSKNNEVTAIKSGGVSLYRIAIPIVAVAAVLCVLSYLILDFVLPYSNQRADALKRKIEGRPPITASSHQKLWFHGEGNYIMNFLAYDRQQKVLSQVQVFEFHPTEFRITRRVYAQKASWNGKSWVFENGWMRSFKDDGTWTETPITQPLALFYSETPDDFATEVKSPDQMTFAQLRRYIDTIQRSGYAAEDLAVKLYGKTSWPVVSMIMVLIALPFSFRMGKKGALYGIGIALAVGVVYWMVYAVFTKFGEVGNLPPLLSAWSANILFGIAAVYMFLHVET